MLTFRFRPFLAVVRDAWPTWLALLGLGLATGMAWVAAPTVLAAVRYAGTVLQLLGVCVVAIGLSEMRRLFGKPTLVARVLGWLRQLRSVFIRPQPIALQASVASAAAVAGECRVVRTPRPGAPLDERVSALESDLASLRDELDAKVGGLRADIRALSDKIKHERRERERADQQTARRVEEVAVGGLHLETVGLFWLVMGTLGTSIPDEIALWISFFRSAV